MTINRGVWGLVTLLSIFLASCSGDANSTGLDFLPDYLKGKPISKEYHLTLRTVPAGTRDGSNSIYVSSSRGYLGRMSSEKYGGVETEYLTQFYMPANFRFKDESEINKIDSVQLYIYYDGFAGDTLANMSVTAHRVVKPLTHSKYSLTEIEAYIGEELGSTSYRAGVGSDPSQGSSPINGGHFGRVTISLDKELGEEFLRRSKAGDPVFSSQKAFDEWFSGVYLHTTAGQGSVLRVASTELVFWYSKVVEVEVEDKASKTKKKEKKLMPFSQRLIHTSEVPQLSRFSNYRLNELLTEKGYANIKAPAGLWVKAVLPTREIAKELSNKADGYSRTLNAVTYTLQGEPSEQLAGTGYIAPTTLLMLPVDSTQVFFEKERTENSPEAVYTTFIGEMVVRGSNSYQFGNIGSAILTHIAKNPDKDLEVYIIPVERQKSKEDNTVTVSLSHLVPPSALKIAIKESNTKLEATIIERREGSPF